MYNPYQAIPYSGFQSPFASMMLQQQPVQPQPAPAANALPPQQVLQANGKASIDALRMAPNSSVLIMDTTAPIVWLCASDGIGNVSATAYDITAHKEPAAKAAEDLDARLTKVEGTVNTIISRWEELTNGSKPNVSSVKPEQAIRANGENSTAQTVSEYGA